MTRPDSPTDRDETRTGSPQASGVLLELDLHCDEAATRLVAGIPHAPRSLEAGPRFASTSRRIEV